MKTITVRDLRHHWPKAEADLQVENEIMITRDSKPVAKLVKISPSATERARWDPVEHGRWQNAVSGGKVWRSDDLLARSREDRPFPARRK